MPRKPTVSRRAMAVHTEATPVPGMEGQPFVDPYATHGGIPGRIAEPEPEPPVVVPEPVKPTSADTLSVNARLYRQVSELLLQLETNRHVTLRERVQALVAIGRIQVLFVGLRKEKGADDTAGSTVRKYAGAFKNDAGRRAARSRRSEPEPPTDWFERPEYSDDDEPDDAAE